jgi:hypothetical protein
MLLSVDLTINLCARPGLGEEDQICEFPEAKNLPRWIFFCVCGYVKNIVYGENIRDLRHIQDMTTVAIATGNPSRYDSADLTGNRIETQYLPSEKWRTYRNILRQNFRHFLAI